MPPDPRHLDARAREIEALVQEIEALGARIESLEKIDIANHCIGKNTVRLLKFAAHGANYRDVEWQQQAINKASYRMNAALKAVLETL